MTTASENPKRNVGNLSLKPHQLRELEFLRSREVAMLLSEAGTGKTVSLLLRSADVLAAGGDVLWLTRKALLRQVQAEAARWIPDSPQPKALGTRGTGRFVIATHELARTRSELRRPWSLLIVDEAQVVGGGGADPKQQVFKAISEIAAMSDRRVFATAEPLGTQHALDLWAIATAAGVPGLPSRSQVGNWIQWAQYTRFGSDSPRSMSDYGFRMLVKLIAPYSIRTKLDDVADLPPITERVLTVPLTTAASNQYQRVSSLDGLRGHQARSKASRDINALIPATVDLIIGEYSGAGPIVLFSEQFDMLDAAEARLEQAGVSTVRLVGSMTTRQRERAVQLHLDGGARVLLMTGAGEAGLNLQHAGVMISIITTYSPAREYQRVARIRRTGTEHNVLVHHIIRPDASHEFQRDRKLDAKRALQERLWALLAIAWEIECPGTKEAS